MSQEDENAQKKDQTEAASFKEKEQNNSIEQIEKDLEIARAEACDYLNSLQRLKAEFENFRKRMLKEQSAHLTMASRNIIIKLLPVLNNFERALSHADQTDFDDFYSGVKLLYNQLNDVLEKEGLKEIDPLGCEFDPQKHEAMMRVVSKEHKENTVAEVFEKGYELKGKVIKVAKVKVAQGSE